MAGRHVASLLEDDGLKSRMAAYTVVYGGHTVCMRVPEVHGSEDGPFLLIWSGQNKHPWRVDSCLLPRDWTELRQMTRTAQTAREYRPEIPRGSVMDRAA